MFVIGIVGSPAGGKSTVAKRLQELGATWINADLIAREVLQRSDVRSQLVDHFGPEIANHDGLIDRSRLAAKVFGADDSKRAALTYLEGIIHPPTREMIRERLHQSVVEKAVASVLDVPLLFESGWDLACDQVWCVDSDFELRLARAQKRGWDANELKLREANQISIELKRQRSTNVILNNDSLASLLNQVDQTFQQLINDSSSDAGPNSDEHCT